MDLGDAPDLLGNRVMPVRQNGALQLLRALFNVVMGLSTLVGVAFLINTGRTWLINWREHNYKKSVRRKYGIPDDDNEPFNVAYAKAQARRKELAQKRAQQQSVPGVKTAVAAQEGPSIKQDQPGPSILRRRTVPPTPDTGYVEVPGGLFSPPQNAAYKTAESEASKNTRTLPKAKPDVTTHDYAASPRQRKRSLEKDIVDESSKKSRNTASDQTEPTAHDASKDANVDEIQDPAVAGRSRGAKRQAASDEEIASVGSIGKKAGKRARRQSRKLAEVINIDENDEQMDVDHVSRGKKRDRAEADSTFGGDDESVSGRRGRKSRRQKHKSSLATNVDSATPARGTKRSYEVESTIGSEEDDSASRARSPRKRGKRMVSDASMTESPDISVAGRRIGEEWDVNGVTYKVGPDGQRLRQVLLKKRASRYSMPEDSQHPDSQARLEILVETWLNDDEFKIAEKHGEIYTPNKKSRKVKELIATPEPGKPLLWALRHSGGTPTTGNGISPVALNGRVGVDPFEHPSLTGNAKRVSIGLDSPIDSPSGSSSPAIRSSKSYSKWEKQDLEAEAMAKLRKKLEDEKKVAMPPPIIKKVSFQLPSTGSESSTSAPTATGSSSVPTSMPAASEPSKTSTPAPTATANANTLFPPPVNNQAGKAVNPAATATANATAGITRPTINLPSSKVPQDSSTPAPAAKFGFGVASNNNRPAMTSTENKGSTSSTSQATAPSGTPQSTSNIFGPKPTSGITVNGAAGNMFSRPAQPNVQTPASNGVGGGAPIFSFGGKDAAQSVKPTERSVSSSLANPANKAVSPAPSLFGAPAKDSTSSDHSNAVTIGSNAAGTVQPVVHSSTAIATPGSQLSLGTPTDKQTEPSNKPTEQSSVAGTSQPTKFNFGFGAKPTVPASTSTGQSMTATTAPAPATSATPSTFGSNVAAAQNRSSEGPSSGSISAPASAQAKFPFGALQAQSSSSTTQIPAAFGNTTGTSGTGSSTVAPAPTGTAPSSASPFAFAAPKTAGSTSSPSPFSNAASTPSPFGAAAKPSATSAVSSGTTASAAPSFGSTGTPASPFGAATSAFGNTSKPVASSSPFGNASNSTTSSTAFGNASKPATSFTGFGNTSNTAASSSPFGSTSNPVTMSTVPGNTPNTTATSSPFGNASNTPASSSAFGNTSNTAVASSSPFGQPARPFPFGASTNTTAASTNNVSSLSSGQKQDDKPKPQFSFNFGAASKPAVFGNTSAPGGSGGSNSSPFGNAGPGSTVAKPFVFGSSMGAPAANGNANNGSSSIANAFGTNTGSSVFGQQQKS